MQEHLYIREKSATQKQPVKILVVQSLTLGTMGVTNMSNTLALKDYSKI